MNMNRIKGSLWAKTVALLALALSAVWLGYGIFGMVLFAALHSEGISTDTGKLREYMQKNMAENYGAQLLDNAIASGLAGREVMDIEQFSELEGGSLDYLIEEQKIMLVHGKILKDTFWVYGDPEDRDLSQYPYAFTLPTDGCHVNYETESWRAAIEKPYMWRQQENYLLVEAEDYVQTVVNGEEIPMEEAIPGTVTDIRGYEVVVTHEGNDTNVYYESIADQGAISDLEEVEQIVSYTIYMKLGSGYEKGKVQYFKNGVQDMIPMANDMAEYLHEYANVHTPITIISLIIFLVAAVFLCMAAGHRTDTEEVVFRGIDRLPYGIYAGLIALGITLGVGGIYLCAAANYQGVLSFRDSILLGLCCLEAMVLITAAFGMSTAVRIKGRQFWRHTLLHYLLRPFRQLFGAIRALGACNRSLMWGTGCVVAVVTMLQFFVIAATGYGYNPQAEIVFFFFYKIVEIPLLFWIVYQMEKLRQGGKRVAAGDYSQPIQTEKMLAPFKEHAEHINNVSQGIAVAVEEQMKSERLKTELITNVTHDIKTPLTSIINYVDLIKKEDLKDPTVVEYVEVLDRQSARLKKLIEDLMEASKASTGNLKLKMETCDAKVMLTQMVGEYQEKVSEKGLELVIDVPEKPVYIMADGRYLWRVLDNIMSNIQKYAMDQTRVYITIERMPEGAKLTFKNISKYQLNISSEELMERFVRGDSSRNAETEGHGLGLSIAQSLAKLMRGSLELEIDGDLFKVVLTLSKR